MHIAGRWRSRQFLREKMSIAERTSQCWDITRWILLPWCLLSRHVRLTHRKRNSLYSNKRALSSRNYSQSKESFIYIFHLNAIIWLNIKSTFRHSHDARHQFTELSDWYATHGHLRRSFPYWLPVLSNPRRKEKLDLFLSSYFYKQKCLFNVLQSSQGRDKKNGRRFLVALRALYSQKINSMKTLI